MTENNYEQYVLDYLEGNLTPDQHQAMELFLDQHPAIVAELYHLQEVVLTPDLQVQFERKAQLKQSERGLGMYWRYYALIGLLLLVGLGFRGLYYRSKTPKKLSKPEPMERLTVPTIMAQQPSTINSLENNHLSIEDNSGGIPTESTHPSIPNKSIPKHSLPESPIPNKKQVSDLDTVKSKQTPPAPLMAEHSVPTEGIEPRLVVTTEMLSTIDVKKIWSTKTQLEPSEQVLLAAQIQLVEAHPSQQGKRLSTMTMWKQITQAIVPESFMVDN